MYVSVADAVHGCLRCGNRQSRIGVQPPHLRRSTKFKTHSILIKSHVQKQIVLEKATPSASSLLTKRFRFFEVITFPSRTASFLPHRPLPTKAPSLLFPLTTRGLTRRTKLCKNAYFSSFFGSLFHPTSPSALFSASHLFFSKPAS